MQMPFRTIGPFLLAIGGCLLTGTSPARGQPDGSVTSLGGYGAFSGEALSRPGGGSLIPYAGGFAGFMPYRMAGGGELAFRARSSVAMGPVRSSFSLSSMSAGMGSERGLDGRLFSSLGSRGGMGSIVGGMGPDQGTRRRMPRSGGMGVMPPSFGYPFRQPPSLLTPASGMSMSMP